MASARLQNGRKCEAQASPSHQRRRQSCRLILANLEQLEARIQLSAVSWDGGGDGSSWTDKLNWSTDALPGPADDLIIDVTAANPTVTLSNTSVTIKSLQSQE